MLPSAFIPLIATLIAIALLVFLPRPKQEGAGIRLLIAITLVVVTTWAVWATWEFVL